MYIGSPVPLHKRDFNEQPHVNTDVSEEDWDELHKCRYLRLTEDQENDDKPEMV